jgi:hypothetical protein
MRRGCLILSTLVLCAWGQSESLHSEQLPEPKEVFEQMAAKMDSLGTYQVIFDDVIRQQENEYVQRIDRDGFKESRKTGLRYLELNNRQGKWRIGDEAIRLDFETSGIVDQSTKALLRNYPNDVTIKWSKEPNKVVKGVDCYQIEADISPQLIGILSRLLLEERKKVGDAYAGDPRELVTGRTCYSIGRADSIMYGIKCYDGNGDLFVEQVCQKYKVDPALPDAEFAIPSGLPVFIARTRIDLMKHQQARARGRKKELWNNAAQ